MTVEFNEDGSLKEFKHTEKTMAHIDLVGAKLGLFREELAKRATMHDESKFDMEEGVLLDMMLELIQKDGPAPFGSEEYDRRTAMIQPMLNHHYACNDHHPEYWPDGIADMDISALTEMLCDWSAAAEERDGGPINLTYCVQRFQIDPAIERLLKNTCDKMGFPWK